MKSFVQFYIVCCILLFAPNLVAEQNKAPALSPLPDPMTLEQALTLARDSHPDMSAAQAEVEKAQAQLLFAESNTGFNSYLDLAARRTKLSTTGEEVNDSYARLIFNKTLYDFGHSSAMEESHTANISSRETNLYITDLHHQYKIMNSFLNVLLADFRYAVDNEEMTQRFLKYDKKRERHSLGKVSELELSKAENFYREALDFRAASDINRRSTRLVLALALNRPNEMPNELSAPKLSDIDRDPPEGEELYRQALASNRTIQAIKQQVEAARNRLQAERSRYNPVVAAEVELADYEHETSSRGDYSAAIKLSVPIFSGGVQNAKIADASAELSKLTSQLKQTEYALLLETMGLIKELQILKTRRTTAKQRVAYRDLDLDHKRALYEMEARPTLSDAQARITEAQWLAQKADFDTALVWAKIKMLLGKPLTEPLPPIAPKKTEEAQP